MRKRGSEHSEVPEATLGDGYAFFETVDPRLCRYFQLCKDNRDAVMGRK